MLKYRIIKKVILHDNTQGWLRDYLVSNKKTSILIKDTFVLNYNGQKIAKAMKNSIVDIKTCLFIKKLNDIFCEISRDNIHGYVIKKNLWGGYLTNNNIINQ